MGNGEPYFIAGFREKTGFGGEIYTDPELHTYRALHLHRSMGSSFSVRTLRNAWRAFADGNRQSTIQGDPWQQGGVFVIVPGGEIVYSYASQYTGDHPPIDELVTAARGATEHRTVAALAKGGGH
ncbi:MAG: AhpC/TSA family protein [Proteobacteria bacterium]|nr:AhpC/TSA family protein [Pseudomonadota bacterium]